MFRQRRLCEIGSPRGVLASRAMHLGLIALVVPLLTLTVLFAAITSEWQEVVRRAVVLHLRHSLGRDVNIGALAFSRDGHVRATDLTIGPGAGETRPLFAAKSLDIEFNLVRLGAIPGRPVSAIRRVVVDHPALSLARNARGEWNFQDLLTPTRTAPSKDHFRGEVLIRNGEVRYRDAQGLWRNAPPIDEHFVRMHGRLTYGEDGYLPFRVSLASAKDHLDTCTVTGSLLPAKQRLLAEARVEGADLPYVLKHLPLSLPLTAQQGRANGRCQFVMTADPRTGQLTWNTTLVVDLRDVSGTVQWAHQTLPYRVAQGQLSMTRDMVELTGVRGVVDDIPAEIDGAISAFAHPVFALQIHTNKAPTARITRLIPGMANLPFTWGGTTDGWLQVSGHMDGMQIDGQFSGPTVTSAQFGDFQDIRADIRFSGTTLELANIEARAFQGRVTGDAWLSLDPAADNTAFFTGEAQGVDAAAIIAQFVPKTESAIPGRTTYTLHDLRGTLSGPVALDITHGADVALITNCRGNVALGDLLQGEADAGLRIDANAEDVRVSVERLALHSPTGLLRLRGEVREDATLSFDVAGSEVQLAELGARMGLPALTGTGYFTGRIDGTAEAPSLTGRLHAQEGSFNDRRFSDITADVTATLGKTAQVGISDVHFVSGDTHLTASAQVSADLTKSVPDWHIAGQVEAPRLSISSLKTALGVDLPLEGFAEGRLSFAGSPDQMYGQGSLTISHPTVHLGHAALELDSITVDKAMLHGRTIDIANAQVRYPGLDTPITVSGRASLDPATPAERQLALTVTAPGVDLDKFTTLTNGGTLPFHLTKDARLMLPFDAAGVFTLNANITGQLLPALGATIPETLAQTLAVAGSIDAGDSLVIAGIPFQRCAADLEYQGRNQSLTVSQFDLIRKDQRGEYAVSITEPSSIRLPIQYSDVQLDLHLALQSDHLEQMRQDLFTMSTTAGEHPLLAPLLTAAESIPRPYDGKAKVALSVQGTVQQPLIESTFTFTELTMANNPIADIDGAIAYDAVPRMLTIERLVTSGGPAPDATASLEGTLTLPVKDDQGHELIPGPMNLHLMAQDINPALFAPWLKHLPLNAVQGAATVDAVIDSTTSNPRIRASIDMLNPSIHQVDFGLLAAIVTLENNRLIIGRKVTHEHGGETRVPSILEFKETPGNGSKPLQVYGEIPVSWKGPLIPALPTGEEMFFTVQLPGQGLDVVRAYLPSFPAGDGSMESSLEVRGILGEKGFQVVDSSGYFYAQAPELALKTADPDLPDRLRQVEIDLGFHSDPTEEEKNIITVKNAAATYARDGQDVKKEASALRWVKSVLGIRTKEPFVPGTIALNGAITVDPQWLMTPENTLVSAEEILNRLDYDLFAKMSEQTLVRWHDLFRGNVSAYLHLGNHGSREDATYRPLITGVVSADNTTMSYISKMQSAPNATANTPSLAGLSFFNPDLSVALQFGGGNLFKMDVENSLVSSVLSAEVAFAPTSLLDGRGKPLTSWTADPYTYTASTLQGEEYTGTRGSITGSLQQPVLTAAYTLQPRKSELQLPGGSLALSEGKGQVEIHPGLANPVRQLLVQAEGTGIVSDYQIAAHINGDLANARGETQTNTPGGSGTIFEANSDLVRFEMVSAPKGAPPLDHNDISARLFGVSDLIAAVEGTNTQAWTPIAQRVGTNLLLKGPMKSLARFLGLETLNVSFNPELYPEASLTTTEFGQSRWGSFRFGASRTFIEPAEWEAWLDYRLPEFKRLKNLSVTTDIDSQDSLGVNLQYKLEF